MLLARRCRRARRAPLEVSLNGRDFSASNVSYSFFTHPSMASVFPSAGPIGGDTLVAARTSDAGGLGGGSHYQCRFGSSVVPATYIDAAPAMANPRGPHNHAAILRRGTLAPGPGVPVVEGAYLLAPRAATHAPHGAVLCHAPPNSTATAGPGVLVVDFEVALNGQNFHAVAGGYTYYAPPAVTALGPTRGPSAGGTVVTLELDAAVDESLLNATSCRIGGRGRDLPYVHSRPTIAALAPATQIADGVLQCAAPPAGHTGALGRMLLDFGDAPSTAGDVYGDAAIVPDRRRPCPLGDVLSCGGDRADNFTSASSAQCEWLCRVSDGHLRLTSGAYRSSGSFILRTPAAPLAPPPLELNATFEVLIGRPYAIEFAPEGDGVLAFNFGALEPAHTGLSGAAVGLSVQLFFMGAEPKAEVWLEGARLLDAPLVGGLRTSAWMLCHVEVGGGMLSLRAAGATIIDRLPLTAAWDPQPTWRLGWSASTTRQRDEFLLDNIDIRSPALLRLEARDVELTLNGQQFVPAGAYGYYGGARLPTILHLSPSSGPIEGGTILRVAAANVDDSLRLALEDPRTHTSDAAAAGGETASSVSAYRCFLGARNITANYVNGTARCTTLPFDAGGGAALALAISVNAQDAAGPRRTFTVYGPTVVDGATPLSGPVGGGTLVEFTGSLLGNGSDYRCRFGDGPLVDEWPGANVVAASYDEARDVISCVSPPSAGRAAGAEDLYVSLNGQNFIRVAALTFHYDEALRPPRSRRRRGRATAAPSSRSRWTCPSRAPSRRPAASATAR